MKSRSCGLKFSPKLVRALISGIKKETRRPVKGHNKNFERLVDFDKETKKYIISYPKKDFLIKSPYGMKNDWLHVQEYFYNYSDKSSDCRTLYMADYDGDKNIKWSSPELMNWETSRLYLNIAEDPTMQKLKDMTRESARNEGYDSLERCSFISKNHPFQNTEIAGFLNDWFQFYNDEDLSNWEEFLVWVIKFDVFFQKNGKFIKTNL